MRVGQIMAQNGPSSWEHYFKLIDKNLKESGLFPLTEDEKEELEDVLERASVDQILQSEGIPEHHIWPVLEHLRTTRGWAHFGLGI